MWDKAAVLSTIPPEEASTALVGIEARCVCQWHACSQISVCFDSLYLTVCISQYHSLLCLGIRIYVALTVWLSLCGSYCVALTVWLSLCPSHCVALTVALTVPLSLCVFQGARRFSQLHVP